MRLLILRTGANPQGHEETPLVYTPRGEMGGIKTVYFMYTHVGGQEVRSCEGGCMGWGWERTVRKLCHEIYV